MAKLDILIKADNQTHGPLGQIKAALGSLGGLATTALTGASIAAVGAVTAMTGAVAAGVGQAMDMEQRLADIASVMGVTYDQAAPLGKLIANLGMDPKLKVDAQGAADAIQNLAANGLTMDEILNGAARSTVLLANATGADLGTAANVATDAMALFGIKAEDMKTAVDGIAGVTVASKFGIDDYRLALSQAGGVASAVGVGFDDFNASIAAISPYFASGSDAGTSFKTMLQRLVPQSKEATAMMKQLGLVTEDGQNQFFDANGQLKSMGEIAGLLQGSLAGLSEEQTNTALSIMFGSDAMRAAVGLAKTGSDQFGELKVQLAGVNSEAQASTRMNTLSGQLEILRGVVDGLLLGIGQAFLPMLRDLANWATDFASQNGPAIVAWFDSLAQWITDITPLVMEWGAVFFDALGELGAWMQGNATDFASLGLLWDGLRTAVRAAVLAIVGFIRNNWPAWAENLRQWGLAAWQWLVNDALPKALQGVRQWAAGLINRVGQEGPGWAAQLATWAQAAWQWLREDAMPKALAALKDYALGLLGYLRDNLPTLIASLLRWATELVKWIRDAIPNAIAAFGEWIESVVSFGDSRGEESFGQMVGQWLHTLVDWIWHDLIPAVGPAFADFLVAVLDLLGNISLELAAAGLKMGVAIVTALAEALLGMVGIDVNLNTLRQHIFDAIDGWKPGLRAAGKSAVEALGQGIQAGQQWTANRWDEFMAIMHKHLDDGFQMSDFYNIGKDTIQWILDGIGGMLEPLRAQVVNMAQGVWAAISQYLNWGNFNQVGRSIMEGLRDGIAGMFGEVIDKISEITNLLPQWLKDRLGISSPSQVFADLGSDIMAGLAQGIARGAMQPTAALATSVDTMARSTPTNNYYNTYNVQLAGTGQAGRDVLASVQLLRALYA